MPTSTETIVSPYWCTVVGRNVWHCGWFFATSPFEASDKAIADCKHWKPYAESDEVRMQRRLGGYDGVSDYFNVRDGKITYSTDPQIEVQS